MANSTNIMLKQLSDLLGTTALNAWEQSFVQNVWTRSKEGARPDLLTPGQVEKLEEVWQRFFVQTR